MHSVKCKNQVIWPLDAQSNDANEIYDANEVDDSDVEINQNAKVVRTPTHYFGGNGSVLDYILLSCEFDASYQDSLFEVSAYHTYNRHLINSIFDRDGESTDHGIVLATLTLRSWRQIMDNKRKTGVRVNLNLLSRTMN